MTGVDAAKDPSAATAATRRWRPLAVPLSTRRRHGPPVIVSLDCAFMLAEGKKQGEHRKGGSAVPICQGQRKLWPLAKGKSKQSLSRSYGTGDGTRGSIVESDAAFAPV